MYGGVSWPVFCWNFCIGMASGLLAPKCTFCTFVSYQLPSDKVPVDIGWVIFRDPWV